MKRLSSAVAVALTVLTACAPSATVTSGTDQLDRSVMPSAGPTPEVDFPEIERRTLANGLSVWIVERPGVPLVTAQLILDAGAVMDPADEPGLSSLTAEMLTEGTTNRTAEEIAQEIDFLALSLGANVGRETAVVSLSTLTRNLEPALDLFSDIVMNPSFTERDWDRVQDQRLVSLLQSLDQAGTLASQEFSRRLYGESHPYGRPIEGTPESVRSLTTDELRDFHSRYYTPANADLIVVGDVETGDIVSRIEDAFRGWSGTAPPRPAIGEPPAIPATRIYLIDKPGAAQSQIRIGHIGVARASDDYFPLLVMNTILGGQFTSRINLNLREDKGYTYGASSNFQMGRIAGPFVAGGGVQTAVTRESIIEFMRELEDIRGARPITQDEVDFARASMIRGEPLTLETNSQIAGRINDLVVYDLPLDYYDDYSDHIAAVTVDDVNRVAREYLHPGNFAIVVVGDRAVIEDDLRTLPYPVEVVPLDTGQ